MDIAGSARVILLLNKFYKSTARKEKIIFRISMKQMGIIVMTAVMGNSIRILKRKGKNMGRTNKET